MIDVPLPREIALDRKRWHARAEVAPELKSEVEMDQFMDHARQRMITELKTEILTQKLADSEYRMSVPYPVSLRAKYQSRWWMKPILKLFPLEWKTKEAVYSFTKELRFPESTMRFPDHLGKVVVAERADVSYQVAG